MKYSWINGDDMTEDQLERDLSDIDEPEIETIERNFRYYLEKLINHHSKENGSNTPDFILADYLSECLAAYDRAVRRRDDWHGVELNEIFSTEPIEVKRNDKVR
jgi:hypothetical protein